MKYYVSQIFGTLGLLVMVISLFQKNKNKMLLYVILNGFFFGVQYLLLNAYSAMFSNFLGIFRTYISNEKEKKQALDRWYVLAFFIVIFIVIGVISFDGNLISLLPIIAEIIYVIALWQKSLKRIRLGTLVMVILWLVYDIVIQAYPSLVTDLIVLISAITAICINDLTSKNLKRQNSTNP